MLNGRSALRRAGQVRCQSRRVVTGMNDGSAGQTPGQSDIRRDGARGIRNRDDVVETLRRDAHQTAHHRDGVQAPPPRPQQSLKPHRPHRELPADYKSRRRLRHSARNVGTVVMLLTSCSGSWCGGRPDAAKEAAPAREPGRHGDASARPAGAREEFAGRPLPRRPRLGQEPRGLLYIPATRYGEVSFRDGTSDISPRCVHGRCPDALFEYWLRLAAG